MKLYLAGPMFTPAERDFIDRLADRLDSAGHDCFVPHRQQFSPLDAPTVFAVDGAGLRDASAAGQGINFFVAGAILEHGAIVWSIDEVEAVLSTLG